MKNKNKYYEGGEYMKKTGRCRLSGGKGFTLIEILVVVSIIAILVAIALMVFGKGARINARKAAFKADIGVAVRSFILQCDDSPPIVPANTPNTKWDTVTASGSPIPGTDCGPFGDGTFSIKAVPASSTVQTDLSSNSVGCDHVMVSEKGGDFSTCP